jgi:hypothetical protein
MSIDDREAKVGGGLANSWPWVLAWFVLGSAYAFGVLSLLSIGVFILAAAAVATVPLAWRAPRWPGVPAFMSGFGVPLLYVAYLNRGGPGWVCTTTANSQECEDLGNPWPWLVAGAVLIVGGIALLLGLNRRRARHGH